MRLKLITKFIFSLLILGLVLTISISMFSYTNTKKYFEEVYAQRVVNGSQTIAKMLSLEDVKTILSEDGDQTETYQRIYDLLCEIKVDSEITYLSLVTLDEDSVTFYIDTCVESMGDDPANQIPYGTDVLYTDAASSEEDLQNYYINLEYYSKNQGVPTPLVTDNSYGYNYSASWPILDENGQSIAEIQYILDMQEVRDYLNSFLYTMLAISFGIILLAIICYILFVRKTVTTPIGKLAAFTRRITSEHDFHRQTITLTTKDEIEDLGNAFNFMLEELDSYIDNLATVTAEKERIGAELNVAAKIQADMLPCIFPAFPNRHEFDIHASMTPAKEVGGDFYDFFLIDDDHLAMVMADVSGKGVPAALFMMISKTLLKSAAQSGLSPHAVLEQVNNQLCENNDAEMFVTVWLGILEISTGKLRCANAGHEYPAIRRAGGQFELFKDKHGFVLAGMENVRYKEYELALNPGDMIFVYTDGVAEATDANNELFGTDRMLTALNRNPNAGCAAMLNAVHKEINTFVGDAPQFDDITMLCLEITPHDALILKPTEDSMAPASAFVENILRRAEVPDDIVYKMDIAVDEMYSNIIRYSGASEARIECRVEDRQVELIFSDDGIAYDPVAKPDPDVTLSAEDRSIGGLGIYMVKKSMDEMHYKYEDGRNVLILRKNF